MSAKPRPTISERTLVPAGLVMSTCVASAVVWSVVTTLRVQTAQHAEMFLETKQSIANTAERLATIQTDVAVMKNELSAVKNSLALRPTESSTSANDCMGKKNQDGFIKSGRAYSMKEFADCTFKEWGL